MRIKDILRNGIADKGKRDKLITARISTKDKLLLDKNNISPTKLVTQAIEELKVKLKKETEAWS